MPNYPHVVKPDMTLHEAQEALHDMFPRDQYSVHISICHNTGTFENTSISGQIWSPGPETASGDCLYSVVCKHTFAEVVNSIREKVEATLPALHPDSCEYCGATCDGEVCNNPWCCINCEAA